MTVAELIERLRALPQDLPVVLCGPNDGEPAAVARAFVARRGKARPRP